MPTHPIQPDLVIAHVDPARLKAHIWKPILRGVLNLLIVPFAAWGGYRLGNQISAVSAAARTPQFHFPVAVYVVCSIPAVCISGILLLEAWRQWHEKQMVIHDGCVTFTAKSGYLSRFELANIAELHLRKKGSPKKPGKDAGVGLRLIEPRYITPRRRTARVLPMIGGLFSKSHLFFPCVYDASDAEIAARLQQAILAQTGRLVPVCVVAGNRYVDGPPVAVPIAQAVGIVCCECGYDLRGLASTAACPECGTPVRRSEGGFRLANANSAWVARLRLGATLLALAGLLAMLIGGAVTHFVREVVEDGDPSRRLWALAFLGTIAASILFMLGAWFFTRPNPRRVTAGEPWSRRIAQGLLLLPLTLIPLRMMRLCRSLEVVSIFVLILSLAGLFVLWYSRAIWRLVPNRRWRTVTTVLAVLFALIMLPADIGFAGGMFVSRVSRPGIASGAVAAATSGPTSTPASPFDDPSISPDARRALRTLMVVVVGGITMVPPLLFFVAMGWLRVSMPRSVEDSMPPMARPANGEVAPFAPSIGRPIDSATVGSTGESDNG